MESRLHSELRPVPYHRSYRPRGRRARRSATGRYFGTGLFRQGE